jgi:ribonuclease Z
MEFELLILGTSSALPAHGRFPSCYALQLEDRSYLFDCGEGAQIRMSDFGVSPQRIHQIFISHLHGDHFFGLPGVITSQALLGRTAPLSIFGPPELEKLMRPLVTQKDTDLPFELRFESIDPLGDKRLIFEDDRVEIGCFPLQHRVPTMGFWVKEKAVALNILPEAIQKYGLSVEQIKSIKKGEDLTLADGSWIANQKLTLPPFRTRTFVYCTDTRIQWELAELFHQPDLLLHETTFTEEFAQRANETGHATAAQAAELAKRMQAGKLITGHYSSRFRDLQPVLEEALSIYPDTWLGEEGGRYRVLRTRVGEPPAFERTLSP